MTTSMQCPKCGSLHTVSRGSQIRCQDCKKYTAKISRENSEVEYGRNFINVICASRRILTETDVIRQFQIDTTKWEIETFTVKTSEGYRKDRKVDWKYTTKGHVAGGSYVKDSGKMLVVPLYHVRARFIRKISEIKDRSAIESFIRTARKFSPKYPRIKYRRLRDGLLMEVGLPDMQLGRLVMASEAGADLTPDSVLKQADTVVDQMASYAMLFSVNKILFPIGNDFFDANTAEGKTAHGTPQRDDVRWQRTFDLGSRFMVRTIDKLCTIAPVDVLVVPGNHDEERMFYLGEYLSAWYRRCRHVNVDNRPMKRKYYQFERNLIGLTHGYYERNDKLAALMPQEVPKLWAQTQHREWHLGDKHHKVDMIYKTDEMENGVVIRILRSISSPSVWEFDKGFVGSLRAGEAFLWHPVRGLVAQFTCSV